MQLILIAFTPSWELLGVILKVGFGLGMVIFVHELGHFLVAKACGVKCEKFFLGFDIFGLKLAHFKWGETEYGIGILPLGGYVKMLGQDDNPTQAAAERERSRLPAAAPDGGAASGETFELDPRSYMAKSVPQRMAIISAGVIMNVLFAVLMAAVAYSLGVTEMSCGMSAVNPGEGAWKADLQPGDKIVGINGRESDSLRYRDLMNAVMLANLQQGVDFEIERPGVEKPFWVNVKPDQVDRRLRPTIGVSPLLTTQLSDQLPVAIPGTPAAEGDKFKPDDEIISVGGQPVKTYNDLEAQLTHHVSEPLVFQVKRRAKAAEGKTEKADEAATTTVDVEVAPRPMLTFGLVMKLGKIAAVQKDSPAAAADIRAGDTITAIDGEAPGDPLRLSDQLARRAGQTVTLSLSRPAATGSDEKLEKQVTLRAVNWPEEARDHGSPAALTALGVAVKVLNIVNDVEKGSPAAQAQLELDGKPANVPLLAAGDEITKIIFELPKPKKADPDKAAEEAAVGKASSPEPMVLGADDPNWPYLMYVVQQISPETKYTLVLKDGHRATISPVAAEDWFYVNRGLLVMPSTVTTRATSLGQAMSLGAAETIDGVLSVYAFLRRVGSQISLRLLGGPVTIAEAAGRAAYSSVADLLIFLTMLSANLAVINFLPIPLLDGGHMVFLLLEGILRRPVNERVVAAFHYAGFALILTLMFFVLGLDIGLIPRR